VAQSTEWAQIYRPRTFEAVHGQAAAVEALSNLIRTGDHRSVVISGPTGAGKTTLARVYAQALVCKTPQPSGSPCRTCVSCRQFEVGTYYDFRDFPPRRGGVDDIRELVADTLAVTPRQGPRHVVLFDEAAGLSPAAHGVLNETLDSLVFPTVFIFTLINAGDLSEPLTDRMAAIELAEADPGAGVAYLRSICQAEQVDAEDEALGLIAGATASFREAIRDLQTLAGMGPVTVDSVRRNVLGPRFGWLTRYFDALIAADLDGELHALQGAQLRVERQADLILAFINALKLGFIRQARATAVRRFTAVADEDCVRLLKAFEPLAANAGLSLGGLWDEVMRFWSFLPERLTPEVLQAHTIRFHDLIHPAEPGAGAAGGLADKAVRTALPAGPAAPHPRQRIRTGRPRTSGRLDYLTFGQTAALYEAATFALQADWAPFNMTVRLDWCARPARDDEALSSAASDLTHQLQLRLEAWGYGDLGGFHRVLIHQRDRAGKLFTMFAGHVPDRHVVAALDWLDDPAHAERWGVDIDATIDAVPSKRPQAVQHHWALMRGLWRGVDPAISVDKANALVDILEIAPNRRRPAGLVRCRRFSISDGLGVSARRKAAVRLFPHFSVFAARRWDKLYAGWESAENRYRQHQLEFEQSKEAALKARFGTDGPLAAAARARGMGEFVKNQIDKWSLREPPW
jgi:DNA polymerase III subunit gamma/tau